jgi:hypothetical protein
MAVIRASGTSMGSGDLDNLLPDPFASRFVGTLDHLRDEYFHWGSQVDDLGLQQVLQLWESPATAPDLSWWANVVTDDVTFVLTADHGFEAADPACTGSWRPALDALGLPYRDEGPGFVYLGAT